MDTPTSNFTTHITQTILSSTPKEHGPQKQNVLSKDLHERRTPLGNGNNRPRKDNTQSRMEGAPKIKIIHEDNLSTMKVYEDQEAPEKCSAIHCSRLTQTDLCLLDDVFDDKRTNDSDDSGRLSGNFDQEAFDLMVNGNVSENYWKDLAEERRRALNDTLEENEKLHNEIKQLKEENSRLSDIAMQAESLQSLLQDLCSDDENAVKETSTEEPEDSSDSQGDDDIKDAVFESGNKAAEECIETTTGKSNVATSESSSGLDEENPSSSTTISAPVDSTKNT